MLEMYESMIFNPRKVLFQKDSTSLSLFLAHYLGESNTKVLSQLKEYMDMEFSIKLIHFSSKIV